MASPNIFRVGDFVFVESSPSSPYLIRRIEELTKTSHGQVDAKVQCYYRHRDLSSTLTIQADRHAGTAEEDGEIDMGDEEVDDVTRHQIKHRELFLSRQLDTINANLIRGKCLVTLYNEVEVLPKYLEKEDWFFYCLVYDPHQKTLIADKGDTGVGFAYQAVVPKKLDYENDTRDLSELETLVWNPENPLNDKALDQFLVIARSVGTFARALDCSSSVKQPSLHMSAAAASRDITLLHAMNCLHSNNYDVGAAIASLVPAGGPVLCRDEMEEWSAGEANLFEEALQKYGKDFTDIQKDFLPWKSISSIVEYYYMWKTTDRYVQQKRQKQGEKETNLTQIFIPSFPASVVSGMIPGNPNNNSQSTGLNTITCEGCFSTSSTTWYPWGASGSKVYICAPCWTYWKKYGGLKRLDDNQRGDERRYTCRICGKVFNRAERLSSHMLVHKPHRCSITGCGKAFNTKANLTRHLATNHGIRPSSPRRLKPKSPFFMKTKPLAKVSRLICKKLLKLGHIARNPWIPVNSADIKQICSKTLQGSTIPEYMKKKTRTRDIPAIKEVVEKLVERPLPPTVPADENKQTKPLTLKNLKAPADEVPPVMSATSPTYRKMLMPTKGYVAIAPGTKADFKTTTNHSMSRKRSLDSVPEKSTMNGPAPKRLQATSPLGKKGCECRHCGKILHNQASLALHVQTVHNSNTAIKTEPHGNQAPKQRSYPAYCDVNSASVHGSTTKIMSYAEHTVTSYNNGQSNYGRDSPGLNDISSKGLSGNKLGLSNKPSVVKHMIKASANSTTGKLRQHNQLENKSNHNKQLQPMKHSSPSKRIVNVPKKNGLQYIDPPEEFVFSSTKDARKARRGLSVPVQKRAARRPWREVKCANRLYTIIACEESKEGRQDRQQATVEPIVIDDDD